VRRRLLKVTVAAVAALALAVGGLTSAWLAGVHVPFASGTTYMKIEKLDIANNAVTPDGTFFVLLVGSDLRPGISGSRGDALHLVGINPKAKAAAIIDIPRDTCFNGDKINAYNTRGPRAQADAVSGLTGGTPIQYVIEVDFAGFVNIINGMGGINVDVPVRMDDPYSGATFEPGPQDLTGQQALSFSRNRHDFPSSDLQRTQNQGLLLIHALKTMQTKAKTAAGEFKLLALFGRHSRLEGLGLKDLYRLGRIAHKLPYTQVRNILFPTAGGSCMGPAASAASLMADFRDDAILQSH
jgi:LCP family protein required for cell wall assembly